MTLGQILRPLMRTSFPAVSKKSRAFSWVSRRPQSNQGSYRRDPQREAQDGTREVLLQNADRLLWSAMVITGDLDAATDCLLEAADEACGSDRVRPGSVMAWAKPLVIEAAIRKMLPHSSAFAREDHMSSSQVEKDCESGVLPSPETALSLCEGYSRADLLSALLNLDCSYRTVYLLRVLEGWTRREVASMLELPESTIERAERTALVLFAGTLLSMLAQQSPTENKSQNMLSFIKRN